ncbi:MAG: Do family serine endopeptidase [Sphingomonas sp.]|nr:Do family serine endopeptidase [Sphingomonas sp.]
MRYAYAISGALLVGGAAATLALQPPAGAQTAQNEPTAMAAIAPRAGAPASFADLVARLQPAVVNISTKQSIKVQPQANPFAGTPFQDFFGGGQDPSGGGGAPVTRQAQSLGSGFLVSPDGYVVTNNHVVAPGARGATVDSITVILTDRKEYKAKLIGRDPASDLALLKIDATNLPFVKFGDSTKARVGDWIIAIGNPFGIGSTVTAGIISALHRSTGAGGAYDRFIQTDAAINQGNSGGPMFDLSGNVIGINSQIFSQSGGNIGIGFAIPAEEAKPIIETLMKGAAVQRGYLGVGIQPLSEDDGAALGLPKGRGEIINRVEAGGPADKAGIKTGDLVLRVNGQEVTVDQTLSYLVANVKPGGAIKLDINRDGKNMTLNAVAGTRPSEDALAASVNGGGDENAVPESGGKGQNDAMMSSTLGLSVTELNADIRRALQLDATATGVVIVSADPSSDAAQKGLQRGDLIVSVNRTPVANTADMARVISQAKAAGREAVLLYIQRARLPGRFISVRFNK